MRVAQLIDEMRLGGGAESLQFSFADAARRTGVDVTVVTLRDGEPEGRVQLEALGARVVSFHARRFLDPLRAYRLLRFLRREGFDVVHTHLVRSTILGVIGGRLTGTPVVATLHNTRRNRRLPRLLRGLEALLLRWFADRVVAVGWETARAHRERLGGRHIDVIPNAVALPPVASESERAATRRELGVPPGGRLLIAVGRLNAQKAYPVMLEAFTRLRDAEGVRLCIVGRGRHSAEVESEVERRGLGDRVSLLGLRHDVPRLLAASDVFVSSSAWEGLPVAVLEAMATGLPIVAASVGGVPRIVDEASGLLVAPGSPEALAEALDRVLGDPDERARRGEAARRRVSEQFGTERWCARLVELYGELDRTEPGTPRRASEATG